MRASLNHITALQFNIQLASRPECSKELQVTCRLSCNSTWCRACLGFRPLASACSAFLHQAQHSRLQPAATADTVGKLHNLTSLVCCCKVCFAPTFCGWICLRGYLLLSFTSCSACHELVRFPFKSVSQTFTSNAYSTTSACASSAS